MVASLVATVARITLLVAAKEFVTTNEVASAAKLTEPAGLSIVCAPVVPPAVIVLSRFSVVKVADPPLIFTAFAFCAAIVPASDMLAKVCVPVWFALALSAAW